MNRKIVRILAAAVVVLLVGLPLFAGGGGEKSSASGQKVYSIKLAHGVSTTDPLHPTSEKSRNWWKNIPKAGSKWIFFPSPSSVTNRPSCSP